MNVLKMNNIQVTSKQNPSLAAPRLDNEWKFQMCHVKTILRMVGIVNRFGSV